jgi:hypothetical protein
MATIFGKVLAFLNIVAAIAFLALAAADWSQRQRWAYCYYRHVLALEGLPVEKDAPSAEGQPSPQTITDETAKAIFSGAARGGDVLGGGPVKSQEEEVERVRRRIIEVIASAGDDEVRRNLLAGFLLNLADDGTEREAWIAQVNQSTIPAEGVEQWAALQELIADPLPKSTLDEAEQQITQLLLTNAGAADLMSATIPPANRPAYERKCRVEIAKILSSVARTAREKIWAQQTAEHALLVGSDGKLVNDRGRPNFSLDRLAYLGMSPFARAKVGRSPSAAELKLNPGTPTNLHMYVHQDVLGEEGTRRPLDPKRFAIAQLLANLIVTSSGGGELAIDEAWQARVQAVTGIRYYMLGLESSQKKFVQMIGRLVNRIEFTDRKQFEAAYNAYVEATRPLAGELQRLRLNLQDETRLARDTEDLAKNREAFKLELDDQLMKTQRRTMELTGQLHEMQARLFANHQRLGAAQERTRELEEALRKLELGR